MTRYPDAIWRPITRNYTNTRRAVTRGIIWHVAVSEASSLHGWFNDPRAKASSHLYLRRDGTWEQYVDLDLIAWTSGAASSSTIGVETQGMGHGTWTDAQIASMVEFSIWAYQRYKIPLQLMRSSRPSEVGHGWHAQGVALNADQKRRGVSQTGGQLWSSSIGKTCPGPDRIKQIPAMVAAARARLDTSKPAPSKPTTSTTPTPEHTTVTATERTTDMRFIKNRNKVYATDGVIARHIPDPTVLNELKKVQAAKPGAVLAVSDATVKFLDVGFDVTVSRIGTIHDKTRKTNDAVGRMEKEMGK